jgi:xylan 1,4-beta-xylosidase
MKAFMSFCFCSLLLSSFSFTQDNSSGGLRVLRIDAGKTTGRIRSFQGLNGPPTPEMAGLPNLVEQYKALRVNQVRTHDYMGPTDIDAQFTENNPMLAWLLPDASERAGVVKAGNMSTIFPNWKADPDRSESYNFDATDEVLSAIHDTGAEVYYRIGRSWGANNVNPPPDFDKYANVVKHVAMHYNQGWANGFHFNIRYWEFWNEPEALFWSGTPEQFYSLYEKTARALKSVDPALKVGGDAKAIASNPDAYREGFIDYCAAHHLPLDFYSWHTYAISSADAYDAVRLGREIRNLLDTHGYPNAESILSEWNLTPDFTDKEKKRLRSAENAAFIGATLSYLEDAPIDYAHFYRGDAAWMGLFDLDGKYFKTAYAFEAMGRMQDTPERLGVEGTDTFGFAALAGKSVDGKKIQILISNYAIPSGYKPEDMKMPEDVAKWAPLPDFSKFKFLPRRTDIVYRDNAGYDLTIDHLPWSGRPFHVKRYRISKSQNLEFVAEGQAKGENFHLLNPLAPDALELIVLDKK